MTEQRFAQIRALLEAALDRDPDDRENFLSAACAGDDEMLAEMRKLLKAHEDSRGILNLLPNKTSASTNSFDTVPRMEGKRLGAYLIDREIGHGGMGVVYSATRADGAFQKQFALKVVKPGLATKEVIQRFQREREILGSLDHPNIARLIDAGTTDEALPYYVMEFVPGEPIDAYCDKHLFNTTQRVELFRKVCRAVQYAHQNLVVHRDLKPSNILVDRDGTVKLLDFGIAKLLEHGWSQSAAIDTGTGIRLMTPEYASPEQIKGEAISTATDVYALGVILYELLTGRRPYRLKSKVLHEVERAICEEEPTRPSSVVDDADSAEQASSKTSKISAVREGNPSKLRRRLAGDIDNILLMALRKRPSERYGSAEQFSADLERHLKGLPVLAHGDKPFYQAKKFLIRHKAPIAAAVSFTLLMLAALFVTVRLYWKATEAQLVATRATRTAQIERHRAEQQTIAANAERRIAEAQAARADERQQEAQVQAQAAENARVKANDRQRETFSMASSLLLNAGSFDGGLQRQESDELILSTAAELEALMPDHVGSKSAADLERVFEHCGDVFSNRENQPLTASHAVEFYTKALRWNKAIGSAETDQQLVTSSRLWSKIGREYARTGPEEPVDSAFSQVRKAIAQMPPKRQERATAAALDTLLSNSPPCSDGHFPGYPASACQRELRLIARLRPQAFSRPFELAELAREVNLGHSQWVAKRYLAANKTLEGVTRRLKTLDEYEEAHNLRPLTQANLLPGHLRSFMKDEDSIKWAAWMYLGFALVDTGRVSESVDAYQKAALVILNEPFDSVTPGTVKNPAVDEPLEGISQWDVRALAESFWDQGAKISGLGYPQEAQKVAALCLALLRKVVDAGLGEVDYAERLLDSPYPALRDIPAIIHYSELALKKSKIQSDVRYRSFQALARGLMAANEFPKARMTIEAALSEHPPAEIQVQLEELLHKLEPAH